MVAQPARLHSSKLSSLTVSEVKLCMWHVLRLASGALVQDAADGTRILARCGFIFPYRSRRSAITTASNPQCWATSAVGTARATGWRCGGMDRERSTSKSSDTISPPCASLIAPLPRPCADDGLPSNSRVRGRGPY